ncbi:MAG: rod shape-determining protein MreD [Actinomycetota bacterium]
MSAPDALDPLTELEARFAEEAEPAAPRRGAGLVPPLAAAGALLVAVYLQVALAIDGRVLGAVADLAVIVIVAIALRFGPAWGAAGGFAAGLVFDVALQLPLGSSSLVLTPIGWAVGAFGRTRRRVSLGMAVILVGAAALAHALGDSAVEAAVEGQPIASGALAVTAVAATMFTLLVSIALLPLLRRILGVSERSIL